MHITEFIHQKSYEHIVYMVRRHPITFAPTLIFFLILLAVAPGVWLLLGKVAPGLLTGSISYPLLTLLGSTYLLSIISFFFTNFVTFYLDMLIVTNDRLMSVRQQGLFSRTISELDLYKIQDITSEVHGAFATLFGYGTLTIQTAGAHEEFVIQNIPHPEQLRQAIMDLAEEDRKYHTGTAAEKATGVMP